MNSIIENEIHRIKETAIVRARMVKRELLGLLTTNQQESLTVRQIINCLALLFHEPIVIFIYEKTSKGYERRDYMNADYALKSRNVSAQLSYWRFSIGGHVPVNEQQEPEEPLNLLKENSKHSKLLFQIFGTEYFLRVFWYNQHTTKKHPNNINFEEFNPTSLDNWNLMEALDVSRHCCIERELERNLFLYHAFCTVLNLDIEREKYLGGAYVERVQSVLRQVIKNSIDAYQFEADQESRVETIYKENQDDELILKNVAKRVDEDICKIGSRFDMVYQHMIPAIQSTGLIGQLTSYKAPQLVNLFAMYRSYDRLTPRYATPRKFRGYPFNVAPKFTYSQKEEIKSYFKVLREQKESIRNFGAWVDEKNAYKDAINVVNKEFWELCSSDDGIDNLLRILSTNIGDSATSFTDPIFYSGTVHFRFPFRSSSGLNRIKGAEKIKTKEDLNSTNYEDVMRVCIFYYVSQGMLPHLNEEDHKWFQTELVAYPVQVNGDVIAVFSSFVRVPHLSTIHEDPIAFIRYLYNSGLYRERFSQWSLDDPNYEIPKSDMAKAHQIIRQYLIEQDHYVWNSVFRFYSDCFVPASYLMRRTYRSEMTDFAFDLFESALEEIYIEYPVEEGGIYTIYSNSISDSVGALNRVVKAYARFNPLPFLKFSYKLRMGVDMEDEFETPGITWMIGNEEKYQDNPYFNKRQLAAQQSKILLDVHRDRLVRQLKRIKDRLVK